MASTQSCVLDLFFGTDYHSHLGTRRAGMTVYGKEHGFERAIHNIENTPFRTKFDKDLAKFREIWDWLHFDFEAQPLLMHSHLGSYAITTVGRINNLEELKDLCFEAGMTHFLEMSSGGSIPRSWWQR